MSAEAPSDIDLELTNLLCRKVSVQIQIRDTTFDYGAWIAALGSNRTLEEVTLSLFIFTLGTTPVVVDFFKAIGSLPKLKSLRFQKGKVFCRVPLRLLIELLQQKPASLRILHLQDLELRLETGTNGQEEIYKLSEALLALSELERVALAHCRLKSETKDPILDPLLKTLLSKESLEHVIISSSRVESLGGFISKAALNELFLTCSTWQQQSTSSSSLKELRLLKFLFSSDILTALFGTLLLCHSNLQTLLLSSCHWDNQSIQVLTRYLEQSTHLQELQLLGNCEYFDSHDNAHMELAEALQRSPSLRQFSLVPLTGRVKDDNDEEEMIDVCQMAYVEMIKSNYILEEFRCVRMLSPEWQSELELYLRLNRAGRRHLCFHNEDDVNVNLNDSRKAWVEAIAAANDDATCIYYFLSLNPSLCTY